MAFFMYRPKRNSGGWDPYELAEIKLAQLIIILRQHDDFKNEKKFTRNNAVW